MAFFEDPLILIGAAVLAGGAYMLLGGGGLGIDWSITPDKATITPPGTTAKGTPITVKVLNFGSLLPGDIIEVWSTRGVNLEPGDQVLSGWNNWGSIPFQSLTPIIIPPSIPGVGSYQGAVAIFIALVVRRAGVLVATGGPGQAGFDSGLLKVVPVQSGAVAYMYPEMYNTWQGESTEPNFDAVGNPL